MNLNIGPYTAKGLRAGNFTLDRCSTEKTSQFTSHNHPPVNDSLHTSSTALVSLDFKMFYHYSTLTEKRYGVATVWYVNYNLYDVGQNEPLPHVWKRALHPDTQYLSNKKKLFTDGNHRLVATLGSKTTISKKLQKKDILEVDLPKACETIISPEAPLALRLQSNLLYGVSRVFREQYQYFYTDVSSAHLRITRELLTLNAQNVTLDTNLTNIK